MTTLSAQRRAATAVSASGMVRALLLALAVASGVLLTGCAAKRGGPIPYNVENFGAPDATVAAPLEQDYKISPLDTLKVSVFQVPDLSGEFEVDLTGTIAMPLIGNVSAVDKTARQLEREVAQKLGAKYLQSPQVSIGVKSSTARNVTLDGAVRNPGLYPVNGSITLIQAVAMAAGTSEQANPRRVAIFRQIGGERQAAAFDLTSIRRGEMPDPRIYSGDIIIVDGSDVKAAQREILQALPILGLFNPLGFIR